MKTILIALMVLFGANCEPARPSKPKSVQTWAFCGVHPDDPYAAQKVLSLSKDSGFSATFGPCLRPDMTTYSPKEPGQRYGTPELYLKLVQLNASVGMKTVVYDNRLWSTDQNQVETALAEWAPYFPNIAAWDLGDEFDPTYPDQWNALKDRWVRMNAIEDRTGIQPFTNHMSYDWVLNQALADLDYSKRILSFDNYNVKESVDIAARYKRFVPSGQLMCAINALDHADYHPTSASIKDAMRRHIRVGCTMLLVFGGEMPLNTDGFTSPSAVNWSGTPTSLAKAIFQGSR